MKKILSLLLAFAMLICLTACGKSNDSNSDSVPTETTASDPEQTYGEQTETEVQTPVHSGEITLEDVLKAPETPESDFEFSYYGDDVIEVSKYLGDDEIVVIPATRNGKPVTRLGAYIFSNDLHPNTKAVRLPDSVKSIETGDFALNESLEIFVAGSGLEEIGEGAFHYCTNLKEVVLNDGLETLGNICFANCTALTEIEIPDSVTDIPLYPFGPTAENLTIIGSAGSAAEEHANERGIPFKAK